MPKPTPRVTLHIGLPKCASTSIQRYFAETYWSNVFQGVLYPKAGRSKKGYLNHQPLFKEPSNLETYLDGIQREARITRAKRIVISNEDAISRMKHPNHARAINAILDSFGRENVDILAISRAPAGLINSSYTQFLQGGLWGLDKQEFFNTHDGSIEDFLAFFKSTWGFGLENYTQFFSVFAEEFNVRQISELPLDAKNSDILAEIAAGIGLRKHGQLPRLNTSVGNSKLLLIRDFQKTYGVQTYQQNAATLRRIKLKTFEMDDEAAIRLGLTLPPEIKARFNQDYLPRAVVHRF